MSVAAPGVMANDLYVSVYVDVGQIVCLVNYGPPYCGPDYNGVGPIWAFGGYTTLDSGPAHGALDLNYNGSFTYTPSSGFTGLDRFTYVVHTYGASGAPTPVTILVTPDGDPTQPPTGITVSPTSGLVTTEAGDPAQFSVVLNSKPQSNVTIPLSSSDTTEGSVSTASLTFTPQNWDQTQAVTVHGVDDSIIDGDVAYSIITGPASSGDAGYNGLSADDVSVTNRDNELPPAIAITDVQQNEGNSGTASFVFIVTLSAASYQTVTVNYGTSDGTATAGSDYQAASGMLTFSPGETSKAITVLVNGDLAREANEAFYVNLSGATNATIADARAIATILNDDRRK